jgi:hypothetical protein
MILSHNGESRNIGAVETVETVIARQRHGKHVSVVTDTDASVEDAVFCIRRLLGNSAVNVSAEANQHATI